VKVIHLLRATMTDVSADCSSEHQIERCDSELTIGVPRTSRISDNSKRDKRYVSLIRVDSPVADERMTHDDDNLGLGIMVFR